MSIAVVIPARDEEPSIGSVLSAIDAAVVSQVIVGDNGSRDGTAEVARRHGAEVVYAAEPGYGAACAAALQRLANDIDVVVFVDADGSDDLGELPRLLEPLRRDEADLVIGSRALGSIEPGAMTAPQMIGNRVAVGLIRVLYGYRYTDLGPFRAIRRDLLDRIGMRDRRYGWTVEMQIRAAQLGGRVVEVPVRYRKRIGRSKISGTISGVLKAGFWIIWTILRLARRSGPRTRHSGPGTA